MFRFCHVSGEISFYYLLTEVLKSGKCLLAVVRRWNFGRVSETCNTVGFEVGGKGYASRNCGWALEAVICDEIASPFRVPRKEYSPDDI